MTNVHADTIYLIKHGLRYRDLADQLGFSIVKQKKTFNFKPYKKKIKTLVLQGYSNKDIRNKNPLNVKDAVYNHFIRKRKKEMNI